MVPATAVLSDCICSLYIHFTNWGLPSSFQNTTDL